MAQIEDNICQAIEILVDKALSKSGFDKTIQATILSCTDSSTGEYKIKYQDATLTAYAGPAASYNVGAVVNVLVPGNDFSKTKTIVGQIDRKSLKSPEENKQFEYEIYGDNCIIQSPDEGFELSSYEQQNVENFLYKKDINFNNLISLDENRVNAYIKTNSCFLLKADFTTNLALEHQFNGDYGIRIGVKIKDSSDIVYYEINTNKMEGNPYGLKNDEQKIYVEVGDEIDYIDSISVFVKDFPYSNENYVKDILIRNIELYGCSLEDNLKDYTLKIEVKDDAAVPSLKVRKDLEQIQNQVGFFWFAQNMAITNKTAKYCSYGGEGWECLNDFTIVAAARNSVSETRHWQGTKPTAAFKIDEKYLQTKINNFKCVAVHSGAIVIEKYFSISKESGYAIEIASSNGTQFYYNEGSTTLSFSGIPEVSSYAWGYADSSNITKILENHTKEEYNPDIKDIVNFNIYYCSALDKDGSLLGTAALKLENDVKKKSGYNLVIENGSQMFKYDTNGLSPTHSSLNKKQVINPLYFTLYDDKGNKVEENNISSIEWKLPDLNNSMLKFDNNVNVNNSSLNYAIEETFDINKVDNIIELQVKYQDLVFTEKTSINFIKEGEPGTNGSGFVCKIVPNTDENIKNVCIVNKQLNYIPLNTGKWFRAQLWNGPNLVVDSPISTEEAIIKWSNQKNVHDVTNILIDGNDFAYQDVGSEDIPANIVKCEVAYDGKTFFATLPVLTSETTQNYNIEYKQGSGFDFVTYSSDGVNPSWDAADPFEVNVWSNNINVTNSLSYTWSTQASIYNEAAKKHEKVTMFTVDISKTRKINQQWYIPVSSFTGECLNAAIVCTIDKIGKITIPVHFMLNRFGNAAINGWDGNSISIDADGNGVILAPQVGAGRKEDDNSFTGLVMGQSKEAGEDKYNIGLLGYHYGQRSLFLDAETGKAEFGKKGAGRVVIDPTKDVAELYSGGFYDDNGNETGSGMLLDLTTPAIRFGNGNFSVDADGNLIARQGYLGALTISNDASLEDGRAMQGTFNDISKTLKQTDGKIQNYYTDYDPSAFWEEKVFYDHYGDIWTREIIEDEETKEVIYEMKVWDGEKWIDNIENSFASLFSLGAKQVFTIEISGVDDKKNHPLPPYYEGDLWIQGGNGTIMVSKQTRLYDNVTLRELVKNEFFEELFSESRVDGTGIEVAYVYQNEAAAPVEEIEQATAADEEFIKLNTGIVWIDKEYNDFYIYKKNGDKVLWEKTFSDDKTTVKEILQGYFFEIQDAPDIVKFYKLEDESDLGKIEGPRQGEIAYIPNTNIVYIYTVLGDELFTVGDGVSDSEKSKWVKIEPYSEEDWEEATGAVFENNIIQAINKSEEPQKQGIRIKSDAIDDLSSTNLKWENDSITNGFTKVGSFLNLRGGTFHTPGFYTTPTGDAYFKGTIDAQSGHIGGFTIGNDSLSGSTSKDNVENPAIIDPQSFNIENELDLSSVTFEYGYKLKENEFIVNVPTDVNQEVVLTVSYTDRQIVETEEETINEDGETVTTITSSYVDTNMTKDENVANVQFTIDSGTSASHKNPMIISLNASGKASINTALTKIKADIRKEYESIPDFDPNPKLTIISFLSMEFIYSTKEIGEQYFSLSKDTGLSYGSIAIDKTHVRAPYVVATSAIGIQSTYNGITTSMGTGSGNSVNHGIWSGKHSRWIVYMDDSGNTKTSSNLVALGTVASGSNFQLNKNGGYLTGRDNEDILKPLIGTSPSNNISVGSHKWNDLYIYAGNSKTIYLGTSDHPAAVAASSTVSARTYFIKDFTSIKYNSTPATDYSSYLLFARGSDKQATTSLASIGYVMSSKTQGTDGHNDRYVYMQARKYDGTVSSFVLHADGRATIGGSTVLTRGNFSSNASTIHVGTYNRTIDKDIIVPGGSATSTMTVQYTIPSNQNYLVTVRAYNNAHNGIIVQSVARSGNNWTFVLRNLTSSSITVEKNETITFVYLYTNVI